MDVCDESGVLDEAAGIDMSLRYHGFVSCIVLINVFLTGNECA